MYLQMKTQLTSSFLSAKKKKKKYAEMCTIMIIMITLAFSNLPFNQGDQRVNEIDLTLQHF